jgi:hypothetical protein
MTLACINVAEDGAAEDGPRYQSDSMTDVLLRTPTPYRSIEPRDEAKLLSATSKVSDTDVARDSADVSGT